MTRIIVPSDITYMGPPGPPGEPFNVDESGPKANRPPFNGPDVFPTSYLADDTGELSIKTSTAWGPWIPFRGAPGPPGPEGSRGPIGPPGADGQDGAAGEDGTDPYAIWLAQGNSGTQADYLETLMGEPGPQGPPGLQGPQGTPGAQGPTGLTGAQGAKGDRGDAGTAGLDGAPGPKGDRGDKGDTGTSFQPDAQGTVAGRSAYDDEPEGFVYLNLELGAAEHDQLTYKISGVSGDWSDPYPRGTPGPAGARGPTGPPGSAGPKGDRGDKGDPGTPGAIGPKGDRGDVGPAGSQGPAGSTGPAGATGSQGPQGPKGDKGDAGTPGATGAPGATGGQGPQGIQGPAGTSPTTSNTSQFTQPAAGANVTATVGDSTWMVAGQILLHESGNYYRVVSKPNATSVILTNLAYTGATIPGNIVSNGGRFVPAGAKGADGAQGPQGPTGATGSQGPAGATGSQGPAGSTGPAGPEGPAGTTDHRLLINVDPVVDGSSPDKNKHLSNLDYRTFARRGQYFKGERSGQTLIDSGGWTDLATNSVLEDANLWRTTTTVYTLPDAGVYLFYQDGAWAANATQDRMTGFLVNGTILGQARWKSISSNQAFTATLVWSVPANTTVTPQVWQNSGAQIAVMPGWRFLIVRLS